MKTFQAIFPLFVLITLVGCASTMEGKYSSEVDPDYNFARSAQIVVLADKGANLLTTKYYIDDVVEGLKAKGFKNTYSYREMDKVDSPFDIAVFVNLYNKSSSYEYTGADYGMVDSGITNTNCTNNIYAVSCTSTKQQNFGITGYSKKVGYLKGYYLVLNWYDVATETRVMHTFGASYQEGCSDRGMYEFIVAQSVQRLDFKSPNKYDYKVKMPKDYKCNY